jgi:hypothetical protein
MNIAIRHARGVPTDIRRRNPEAHIVTDRQVELHERLAMAEAVHTLTTSLRRRLL